MTQVVKVLLPLASNEPDPKALVYAEGRKNAVQIDTSDDLRKRMGSDFKAFFNATWTGKTWVLQDRAKWQPW